MPPGARVDQRKAWDAIAASFDRTRTRPWPHVEAFVRSLPPGSRVLDLMAGNGRHTSVIEEAGHTAVALDWSPPLLRLLRGHVPGAAAVVGDAQRLPLRDAAFDACVYVAGLHGIPTAQGRAASLAELHRVLKPDGLAQVTVWTRDAPTIQRLAPPPEVADVLVPWKADGHAEARFYHLYTPDSLASAAHGAGFSSQPVAAAPGNLAVVLRRNAA